MTTRSSLEKSIPAVLFLAIDDLSLANRVKQRCPQLDVVTDDLDITVIPDDKPIYCFVDWVLPEYSGLDMCTKLRASNNTKSAHITVVLESRDSRIQRRALRAGADSYVVGPLTSEMIIGRIDNATKLPRIVKESNILKSGHFTIDLDAYRVRYEGRNVLLSSGEFRLLVHFVENPDVLFTRKMLIEILGKNSAAIDERIVNVWIRRLRRSLFAHQVPDPLRTVRSMGYVMDSVS